MAVPFTTTRRRKGLTALAFLSPTLVFLTVVYIYPLIRLIPMSLQRIALGKSTWVGLFNFEFLLFRDQVVKEAFFNNLKLLVGIPFLVLLAIVFSALLYEKVRGTEVYQALILLPYVLSIPVTGLVMRVLLRADGALNAAFETTGLDFLVQDWLGNANLAIWTILAVIIWRELGMGIALFFAEMLSIDDYLFDAAKVDGANWFQTLIHITIPQLSTIISFYIIYLVIIFFSWTFSYVFVMTNGGPGYSTTVLEFSIYRYAVNKSMPHMSAALSLILLLGMFVFIFMQFRIRRSQIGRN
jgi:ABC-type sugar transport system permease subunit